MRCTMFAAAVLGSAAISASGSAIVTFSDQQAKAEAYWRQGTTLIGNFGQVQDYSGNDFLHAEDRPHAFGGFSGRGFAKHGATFTPGSPGIGGAFDSVLLEACTSAEIWTPDANNSEDRAYGLAQGVIEFSLHAPHFWNWTGFWQGNTYNSGAYYRVSGEISLVDTITGTPIVFDTRTSLNGVGNWADPINYGGTLGAGSYRLTWSHESICANGSTPWGNYGVTTGGAPLTSCYPSTFSVTPVPAPAAAPLALVAMLAANRRRRRTGSTISARPADVSSSRATAGLAWP